MLKNTTKPPKKSDTQFIQGQTFISPEQAFQEAINDGILSNQLHDINYAGNFMYMWTQGKVHHFKSITTRKYGYNLKTIIEASKN